MFYIKNASNSFIFEIKSIFINETLLLYSDRYFRSREASATSKEKFNVLNTEMKRDYSALWNDRVYFINAFTPLVNFIEISQFTVFF
jgi:hypothetical protein